MTVFSHYVVEDENSLANMAPLPERTCTVFLTGGCPITLAFPPSPVEVYNDLDSGVLYFFEVLRKRTQGRRAILSDHLEGVPSFKDYDLHRLMEGYRDTELRNVDRISLWYVCARNLLRTHLLSLRDKKLFHRVGDYEVFRRSSKAAFVYKDLQVIDAILPEVHGRLFRMQFEHYSFEKIIKIYDSPETLFVVDVDHLLSVDDRTSKEVGNMLRPIHGKALFFSQRVGDSTLIQGKASQ